MRISEMRSLLKRADRAYRGGCPIMSDREFDQLERDLRAAFPDAPELRVPGGGNAMLSLDKPQVFDFVRPDHYYAIQPKIDGCSLALKYVNGYLAAAWTRSGRDVLKFVRGMTGVPGVITNTETVEIRGELWLSDRNVVAQVLRGLKNVPCIFQSFSVIGIDCDTEADALECLHGMGFLEIESWFMYGSQISSDIFTHQRSHYPTDGTVIKDNCKKYQRQVGSTSRAPLWAMAVKYADQFNS